MNHPGDATGIKSPIVSFVLCPIGLTDGILIFCLFVLGEIVVIDVTSTLD